MNLIGKVYATITHKRNKNKKKQETTRPKFNFSAVVAGFLVSTTLFASGVTTPAFASDTVYVEDLGLSFTVEGGEVHKKNINPDRIKFGEDGRVNYVDTRNYKDSLDSAVSTTKQFAELVQSGKVDLITVKRTLDSLRESEQVFNEYHDEELTDFDCEALNMIIETYGSPYLEGVPTYDGGITDSRADLLSDVTIIATNFLQSNGKTVGGGTDLVSLLKQKIQVTPTPEIKLSQGISNFKVSDANMKYYNDVHSSAWYYDEVTQSSKLGIVVGDDLGNFNPDANLSYGEAITLAARVNAIYNSRQSELETMAAQALKAGEHWAKGYENYVYKYGVLELSYGERSLDTPCSRYIMAQLFANALPASEYNIINDWASSPDTAEKSHYIKKLFTSGIMIGDDDGFRASDPITRAETACIINRVAVPANRKTVSAPTPTPTPIPTPVTTPNPGSTTSDTAFDYAKYNDPAIRNYLENLRSDPKYGHGAPRQNGIGCADLIHSFMVDDLGIHKPRKTLPSYKDACAGDIVKISGDPVYPGGTYGALVLERKENSITIIDFSLNGKVLYGRTLTFDQLAQFKSVYVIRYY